MPLHNILSRAPPTLPGADQIVHALPFAAYTTDPEGRLTAYNEAAVTLWGRAPELGEAQWCGSHKLYWSDGRAMAHADCPMARTLTTGVAVRGVEAILERPDGSRAYFIPYPTALRNAQGAITGGLNMLVDVSDRAMAHQTNQHFAAIIEYSDDAIISKDLTGTIQSWNKGAERVFGYTAEEAVGQPISLLIPADRLNEEPGILERIRRGERIDHYETVRKRKDGRMLDISLTVSPIKNVAGQVVGASKIARDITERKRAEQTRDLLLHEIKHRVKNTLGTVQAIASQTFREGPRAERDAFAGRLRALSNAHDLLTQQDWDHVSLREMMLRALAPFQENRTERFQVSGEDAVLNANQALLLAMAVHELATNAVKYGALSDSRGGVALSWAIRRDEGGRRLTMEWRESGGPRVGAPTRKGFGSTLIERALQQEQGRSCFTFLPEGVTCTLDMKI